MKGGAENRKKTIALGVLAAGALYGVYYNLPSLFGSSSTPPVAIAPVTNRPAPVHPALSSSSTRPSAIGAGPMAGVAAQKLTSSAGNFDPTLDQAAMLRTEGLQYSGSGRNIFSATYVAPAPLRLPKDMPSARPKPVVYVPPPNPGPPPPPPIPLKFFGTAQRRGGSLQAFLLSGDDVYLAAPGDIVARRFRVGQISNHGVDVTDLGSNNIQTLPLQQQ